MLASSPMLKLDKEIESVKMSEFIEKVSDPLPIVISSLFMEEGDDPLSMESG